MNDVTSIGLEGAALIQAAARPLETTIHLCVPDDQMHHMPSRRRAPIHLPREAPLPRVGEVVNISSNSSWVVTLLIHSWRSAHELRIEIWLDYVGDAGHARKPGFERTQ